MYIPVAMNKPVERIFLYTCGAPDRMVCQQKDVAASYSLLFDSALVDFFYYKEKKSDVPCGISNSKNSTPQNLLIYTRHFSFP